MLSLYRAWLGPPCVARPAPPPGAHRPVPRRPRPPSPASSTSSELDVERLDAEAEPAPRPPPEPTAPTAPTAPPVLDVACCDGPVRFSRVLNAAWRERSPQRATWARGAPAAGAQHYACKTCGCRFPSYYFVHKHRKRCHAEEAADEGPAPATG